MADIYCPELTPTLGKKREQRYIINCYTKPTYSGAYNYLQTQCTCHLQHTRELPNKTDNIQSCFANTRTCFGVELQDFLSLAFCQLLAFNIHLVASYQPELPCIAPRTLRHLAPCTRQRGRWGHGKLILILSSALSAVGYHQKFRHRHGTGSESAVPNTNSENFILPSYCTYKSREFGHFIILFIGLGVSLLDIVISHGFGVASHAHNTWASSKEGSQGGGWLTLLSTQVGHWNAHKP